MVNRLSSKQKLWVRAPLFAKIEVIERATLKIFYKPQRSTRLVIPAFRFQKLEHFVAFDKSDLLIERDAVCRNLIFEYNKIRIVVRAEELIFNFQKERVLNIAAYIRFCTHFYALNIPWTKRFFFDQDRNTDLFLRNIPNKYFVIICRSTFKVFLKKVRRSWKKFKPVKPLLRKFLRCLRKRKIKGVIVYGRSFKFLNRKRLGPAPQSIIKNYEFQKMLARKHYIFCLLTARYFVIICRSTFKVFLKKVRRSWKKFKPVKPLLRKFLRCLRKRKIKGVIVYGRSFKFLNRKRLGPIVDVDTIFIRNRDFNLKQFFRNHKPVKRKKIKISTTSSIIGNTKWRQYELHEKMLEESVASVETQSIIFADPSYSDDELESFLKSCK